jgi:hypothetical protein
MLLMQLLPLVSVVLLLFVVMLTVLLMVLLVLLRYGLMMVGGRLLVFVGKGMHMVVRLLVLLLMPVGFELQLWVLLRLLLQGELLLLDGTMLLLMPEMLVVFALLPLVMLLLLMLAVLL